MRVFASVSVLLLVACGSSSTQEATPPPAAVAESEPAVEPAVQEEVAAREAPPEAVAEEAPSWSDEWERLTTAYVTEDGGFRYAALHGHEADRASLGRIVQEIGDADPSAWERDQKLAFYINAYNALTVNAVIARWPLESVMNVEGFFDAIEHQVAGESRTLNGLEGDVIRGEEFSEPRIHFAVNCASTGCPPLSSRLFTAENLEEQLDTLTRAFLRATTRIEGRRAHMTKLFEWYAGDFGDAAGVRTFLARYLEGDDAQAITNSRTRLVYDDYDWAVNARD